jgi:hypothetical protein
MGFPINGDLVPSVSGFANLGINVSSNGRNAFDITTLRPFGNVHLVSGVFHDPLHGQSGVLRYNRQLPGFEISVDGGLTFNQVATGAGAVSSIGVIGDANLTGNIDLAVPTSGFMTIQDTADASPLLFSVNTLGLSGLWAFPAQGFNGRVVNALTDFNGTEAQGVINVVGASGLVVDIIGQTMTITPGNALPKCFAATFGAAVSWTVTHNLNTSDVSMMILDDSTPRVAIIPDQIEVTSVNVVTVSFNVAQGGRAIVIAC